MGTGTVSLGECLLDKFRSRVTLVLFLPSCVLRWAPPDNNGGCQVRVRMVKMIMMEDYDFDDKSSQITFRYPNISYRKGKTMETGS